MRIFAALLAPLATLVLLARPASADALSPSEMQRLLRGQSVPREQRVEIGGRRYVGGVSYLVLDEPASGVGNLLSDATVWKRVVPLARSARLVGSVGGDKLVELTNGSAFIQATYTMRIRREGEGVMFWMDASRRHDIEDAWGFLRVEPMQDDRTLVTYGVLIDMGPGLVRDLFEDSVRGVALSLPDHLRDLVLERASKGRRASR